MTGMEMVRALRADPRTSGVKILMLTSEASVESETEGLQAGADDYILKPVEPRRLAARVKALLGRRARTEHADPGRVTLSLLQQSRAMRNLKTWQKLAVMGAVFMIPFAVVTYKMTSSINAMGVDFARLEVRGLEYLRSGAGPAEEPAASPRDGPCHAARRSVVQGHARQQADRDRGRTSRRSTRSIDG